MKKLIITVALFLFSGVILAQKRVPLSGGGLYLYGGKLVVSDDAYVVIDGNSLGILKLATNAQDASIYLDGTISVDGNFTNNTSSQPFSSITTGSNVIFAGASGTQVIGGTTSTTFNFDKLTINSGSTVQVTAAKHLTLTGALTNNGTFSLLDAGSGPATLVDNGSISGSGTYNMQQYLTGSGTTTPTGRRWYISSPVASATSLVLAAAGNNRLNRYIESNFNYTEITDNTTSLNVMEGYVHRGVANATFTFTGGAFNTGSQTASSLSYTGTTNSDRGYHLLGNPYPSFYNWEDATLTNVSTTITYRTVNLSSTMVYDTYNGTSQVGTNNNGSGAVTKYIAPLQAFWVSVSSAGTGEVDFSNTGRSHQSATLRGEKENNTLRLNLTDGINTDQFVVNVNSNASNGVDIYDSRKMFTEEIAQVYSPLSDAKLVINSLNEITEDTRIPLSVIMNKSGNYGLEAVDLTGSLLSYSVYLEDKAAKTIHDLSSNPTYTFDAVIGETNNRFILTFKKRSAGIEVNKTTSIELYNFNNQINVVLPNDGIAFVRVSDMSGRIVAEKQLTNQKSQIELNVISGVYNVEVVSGSDRIVKKIVIE